MPNADERIEVFDTSDIHNPEQFEDYVPGIGRVLGLPVVGIWESGILVQKGFGAVGRDLIIDRYSLNRERIMTLP
jgi:hypothetical protein